MASATDYLEGALIDLLFLNTNIANIGDTTGIRGSTTAGNWYVILFTADPTDTGSLTAEATFGGYTRVAVPRTGSGWSRTSNVLTNVGAINFPQCTSGSETITHIGIIDLSASGTLLFHGALNTSRAISTGVTLSIPAGALTLTLN